MKKIVINEQPFSEIKIADVTKLTEKTFANNADALADYLESKPDSAHNQDTWAEPNSKAPCGTRACALGWAALSGIIPGLQYCLMGYIGPNMDTAYYSAYPSNKEVNKNQGYTPNFYPAINGIREEWTSAGVFFFGHCISANVFQNLTRSKNGTIKALRYVANCYRTGNIPDVRYLHAFK